MHCTNHEASHHLASKSHVLPGWPSPAPRLTSSTRHKRQRPKWRLVRPEWRLGIAAAVVQFPDSLSCCLCTRRSRCRFCNRFRSEACFSRNSVSELRRVDFGFSSDTFCVVPLPSMAPVLAKDVWTVEVWDVLRADYDALKAEGALPASTGSVFRSDTS